MQATDLSIRRAWHATCPDGWLRDLLVNGIAARIADDSRESSMAGYPAELVDDFVDRCDAIFAAANPETAEDVEALVVSADVLPLYDLVGE